MAFLQIHTLTTLRQFQKSRYSLGGHQRRCRREKDGENRCSWRESKHGLLAYLLIDK